MTLHTNLEGRLRNTSLPANQALLPVFEAVVNSIHSIEDAGVAMGDGKIEVELVRSQQGELSGERSDSPVVGFRVSDNGAGFHSRNMKSFETLDSDYKADKGGRGVGRLVWLKAFQAVRVSSDFSGDDGAFQHRSFLFTAKDDISEHELVPSDESTTGATIELSGFVARYRDAAPKTARTIASEMFEHCLWYFFRPGGAPKIRVRDGGSEVDLDDVYEEHMHSSAVTEDIDIKGRQFTLTHIKLRANSQRTHFAAYCAASRLVKRDPLPSRVPGLFGPLADADGDFMYACYVGAEFLDERVRSERTDFDITSRPSELFAAEDIGLDEIRSAVVERAAEHLRPFLEANKAKARERVDEFVSHKAPRYRPILARLSESAIAIDPEISDKDLELKLHTELASVEADLIKQGHELLSPTAEDEVDSYRQRLATYLQTSEDVKKSDLANYVFHRRVVLDLFKKALEREPGGGYAREDVIHNLIMPMRTDTDATPVDICNLWLIDERLAFHSYLASDKPLSAMPITDSDSAKEPDILALNVFDNPLLVSERDSLPQASIVVIEIKRPMRNDAKEGEAKDPIEQALGYLRRIREGKVLTRAGRPIPESPGIPGFCYVLCDITDSVKQRCDMHDAVRTKDGMGYFFYHKRFNAYVEVSSFDRVAASATERHRAFFDKLGLPVL